MPEIEFDPVDTLTAGAVGVPGQRAFYIQASKDGQVLNVLVEKEQVAVLADRLRTLVDQVVAQFPDALDEAAPAGGELIGEDPVPLFRALAIGIGFDAARRLVLVELHERSGEEGEEGEEGEGEEEEGEPEEESYLARLYATPAQARVMAEQGTAAVVAGRPPCPLCSMPLDPEGHVCPKLNGHAKR
jgi:uncharacterized repeat protein (TIGR03847 family)